MMPPAKGGKVDSCWLPVLRPQLPNANAMRPWLETIDNTGWYSNFGPLNRRLELDLANHLGNSREEPISVCTTSNGTTGLELALAAIKRVGCRKVLLPSLTFPATATAIIRAGLEPCFADVDLAGETLGLSPDRAEQLGNSYGHDEIAAMVPVAIFGCPQDASGWDAFTQHTGVPVVIDAAGSFGNQQVGKTTSAVFSMHATKSLPCGEGGFFASKNAGLVQQVRTASNFGFQGLPVTINNPGTNAKLSEFHAAAALASLSNWHSSSECRLKLASTYANEIRRNFPDEVLPQAQDRNWIRSVYVVRLPGRNIKRVADAMSRHGVETRRWYHPPLHEHPAFIGYDHMGKLTNTELLANELLGLPFHLAMTRDDVRRVCRSLLSALSEAS